MTLLKQQKSILKLFIILIQIVIISCSSDPITDDPVDNTNNESEQTTEETPLSFSVSNYTPNTPRPGYKLHINGEGFGEIIENINVIFKNSIQENIYSKILTLSDNQIELAIPTTASVNSIQILVNNESLTIPINLSIINHQPVYYYTFTGFRSMNFNSDGEIDIHTLNNSIFNSSGSITSLAYDQTDGSFYGLSRTTQVKYFYFNETTNQKNIIPLCYTCNNDISSVTNTLTNKKYIVLKEQSYPNFTLNFKEVDSNGNILNESSVLLNNESSVSDITFVPEINSYVLVRDGMQNGLILTKINASTFNVTTTTIGAGIFNTATGNPSHDRIIYDSSLNKLIYPREEEIFIVDLVENTIEPINSDWNDYFDEIYGDEAVYDDFSEPYNFVYYEPTNDMLVYNLPLSNKLFAVNLASKETRSLTYNGSYANSSYPTISKWIMKK
ncbi:MAG: hypothetical protein HRT69_16705 [Flavobacteriaceae bacterium]|nr:hypothetical protein [Flavobacteriaceae bacterium]